MNNYYAQEGIMESITAGDILRMAEIPANTQTSKAARLGVSCPKCHAPAGARCYAAGGKTMPVRVHTERMSKASIGWRTLESETVMGFVRAGHANGDVVRVFARPVTVEVGSGVTGNLIARADDRDMGWSAVLLWDGRYFVMQVDTESVRVHRPS